MASFTARALGSLGEVLNASHPDLVDHGGLSKSTATRLLNVRDVSCASDPQRNLGDAVESLSARMYSTLSTCSVFGEHAFPRYRYPNIRFVRPRSSIGDPFDSSRYVLIAGRLVGDENDPDVEFDPSPLMTMGDRDIDPLIRQGFLKRFGDNTFMVPNEIEEILAAPETRPRPKPCPTRSRRGYR